MPMNHDRHEEMLVALRVACPTCSAPPMRLCRTKSGYGTDRLHKARVKLGQEKAR